MENKPFSQHLNSRALIALCICVLLVICFWPRSATDSLNVPLGVEQAAIVTYSGPLVAVMPYKWGVAVNVRIAKVTEQPGTRIYDVRYLKDYLTAEDGGKLDGLPSFKFHGDPKLSKHLDARIQETEAIGVSVGGYYYLTLAALGVLWIVWLLLLIFYGRAKPAPPAAAPPEPTLADLLRTLLAHLDAGTLDAAAKAKLEMLLLHQWREELALTAAPMDTALDAIAGSEKNGQSLRQLQHWLHHPASPVRREEIAAVIRPYTDSAEVRL